MSFADEIDSLDDSCFELFGVDGTYTPAPWHHSMFAAVALAGVGTSPPVTQAMSPLALLNF